LPPGGGRDEGGVLLFRDDCADDVTLFTTTLHYGYELASHWSILLSGGRAPSRHPAPARGPNPRTGGDPAPRAQRGERGGRAPAREDDDRQASTDGKPHRPPGTGRPRRAPGDESDQAGARPRGGDERNEGRRPSTEPGHEGDGRPAASPPSDHDPKAAASPAEGRREASDRGNEANRRPPARARAARPEGGEDPDRRHPQSPAGKAGPQRQRVTPQRTPDRDTAASPRHRRNHPADQSRPPRGQAPRPDETHESHRATSPGKRRKHARGKGPPAPRDRTPRTRGGSGRWSPRRKAKRVGGDVRERP